MFHQRRLRVYARRLSLSLSLSLSLPASPAAEFSESAPSTSSLLLIRLDHPAPPHMKKCPVRLGFSSGRFPQHQRWGALSDDPLTFGLVELLPASAFLSQYVHSFATVYCQDSLFHFLLCLSFSVARSALPSYMSPHESFHLESDIR